MKRINAAVLGLTLAATSQLALAGNPDELSQALRERLDLVETKWAEKDATGIVRETYVAETEITGEQTEPLFTGTEQLTELVDSLVQDSRSARIVLNRVTPLGADSAYSWVTWTVQPNEGEAFKMKSLFVWKHTPEGWRVVADMYATGEIPQ